MTRPAHDTALVPAEASEAEAKPRSRRQLVRRVGVIAVAAAMVSPFALPAFASDQSDPQTQGSLAALVANDAQSVSVEVTAGGPDFTGQVSDATATTPEQLEALRAEIEAEAEAAAASQAASQTTTTTDSNGTATSGTAAATSTGASAQAAAGMGSVIANAALNQLGEAQSCTQLVADSLAAAGISYSGMGNLFNLGPTISQSQATPGDVIYYANGGLGIAHVAIYIGGGQAVHGGWGGGTTVIAGTEIGGSAPVFIDVA